MFNHRLILLCANLAFTFTVSLLILLIYLEQSSNELILWLVIWVDFSTVLIYYPFQLIFTCWAFKTGNVDNLIAYRLILLTNIISAIVLILYRLSTSQPDYVPIFMIYSAVQMLLTVPYLLECVCCD